MKTVALLTIMFFMLPLVGCQTAAQRQATSIRKNLDVANQNARACMGKIETNPAYQSIAKHSPLRGDMNPTLTQLADNGVPSDEDIQAIVAMHNELEPCRAQIIESCMKAVPGIVPTFIQCWHASDLITVDLLQRKITWGEANKRRMALIDDYRAKVQAFGDDLDRRLMTSHQAELAQRQAAFQALSEWSYNQQILWQNQQLINAVNRPAFLRK